MRQSAIACTQAAILILLPSLGFAWQKEYSYEFQMSENDSRNSARAAAVEQIRVLASQEAGTYIQGTTVLQGDDLTETITQIGASIVKVEVKSDAVSVAADGRQTLKVMALADVDESVIHARIAALREDKSKADAVRRLSAENKELQAQLDSLRKSLLSASDGEAVDPVKLAQAEADILAKLRENQRSTQKVFDLGTLAQLAKQAEQAKQSTEAASIAQWDSLLNELASGEIKLDVSSTEMAADGSGYIAAYRVTWDQLPDQRLYEVLGYRPGERISGAYPPGEASEKYWKYVASQRVVALVKIGGRVVSRHTIIGWWGNSRLEYNPKGPTTDDCQYVQTSQGRRCGALFTKKDIDSGVELVVTVQRETLRVQ